MICDDCQRQEECNYLSMMKSGQKTCSMFNPKIDSKIICNLCRQRTVCKYVGNPIRHYDSPDNFCATFVADEVTPFIADTGNRTEFATGAVRDMHEGKGRYDLLPWDAIHELAIHCEEGAKKYQERNVEKGIPIHSLIDSAIRHLSCYLRGMKDEPHLRAAMWNVAFAIWMEKNRPEMQDIPARKQEAQ